MKFILYTALLLVVSAATLILIFFLLAKITSKYEKAYTNTQTTEGFRIHYYYQVPLNRENILLRLSVPSIYDEFKYELNTDTMIIKLTEFSGSIDYQLTIIEKPDYSILSVEQIPLFHGQSRIPLNMNSFWIRKVDAVPIQYSEAKAKSMK